MSRNYRSFFAATPLVLIWGCSGSGTSTGSSTGGVDGLGGSTSNPGSGGTTEVAATSAGAMSGGAPTTGGTQATGSTPGETTGGAATQPTGGRTATSTGGRTTSTAGGAAATGGSSTAGGACSRAVGACTAPTTSVTSVTLNSAAQAAPGTGDTANVPLAIAPLPSGGSRLAWLGTDNNVHIAELDCSDQIVGTPFTIPGIDLQDIYADDTGGVVLLTRNATNGGTDNCGTGTLCGGTSSPCKTMWLVRFNAAGTVQWETQVTNLSTSLAGYQNGARFVWWYQHHGRIAFDGTNYATYFGVAITVNNGNCVDIHEGDRMQVVGPTGTLLTGHQSNEFGCSHAWTSRIVWDSRTKQFMFTCATDNNCRISHYPHYTTMAASACDGNLFNGDIISSSAAGYWDAWANAGQITLSHFSTGAADQSITSIAANLHPHLVTYGASNMLLAWGSGSTLTAQVRDLGTGALVSTSNLSIAANEQPYVAWKSYADGSVAYPGYSSSTSVKIARVMPCQ